MERPNVPDQVLTRVAALMSTMSSTEPDGGSGGAAARGRLFDLGVLLVQGIGTEPQGEVLVRFSDSIYRWLRHWLDNGDKGLTDELTTPEPAVSLHDTRLRTSDEPPHTTLTWRPPQTAGHGNTGEAHVLLAESRWADAFSPPSSRVLATWMLWIVPWLVVDQFDKMLFRNIRRFGKKPWYWWRILFTGIGLPIIAPITILAVLGVLVLLLLSWLRIPGVEGVARAVEIRLAAMFGDSYVLTKSPVQFDSTLETVNQDLEWLLHRCQRVAIISYAQGSAIAHGLLRRLGACPRKLRLFVTVGSGIEKFYAIPQLVSSKSGLVRVGITFLVVLSYLTNFWGVSLIVGAEGFTIQSIALLAASFLFFIWATWRAMAEVHEGLTRTMHLKNPLLPGLDDGFEWVDYYATFDLVPNGSLFENADPSDPRPEGIQVHNRGSAWSDHRTYLLNNDEFVPSLACRLAAAVGLRLDTVHAGDGLLLACARRWRRWRVKWLVTARTLIFLASFLGGFRLRSRLPIYGQHVIDATPRLVRALVGKLLGPFSGLPFPLTAAQVVGLTAWLVTTGAAYCLLFSLWHMWEQTDLRHFLRRDPIKARNPFWIFVCVNLLLLAVDTVLAISGFEPLVNVASKLGDAYGWLQRAGISSWGLGAGIGTLPLLSRARNSVRSLALTAFQVLILMPSITLVIGLILVPHSYQYRPMMLFAGYWLGFSIAVGIAVLQRAARKWVGPAVNGWVLRRALGSSLCMRLSAPTANGQRSAVVDADQQADSSLGAGELGWSRTARNGSEDERIPRQSYT
jgi:hypothetical protein